MEGHELILVTDFCKYHEVPGTFLSALCEAGLIEIVLVEEEQYLKPDEMREVEKLVRIHTEMDINIAGIEAIAHLLHRMDDMSKRLRLLQQRLNLYEGDAFL